MDQHTYVLDDGEGEGFEEGEANARVGVENAGDGNKKGTSQRTIGYRNQEDHVLYHSLLFIIQDPICGAKQKKSPSVLKEGPQEFHEHRQLIPFQIHSVYRNCLSNRGGHTSNMEARICGLPSQPQEWRSRCGGGR
jgi:hypothetical protein